MKPKNNSQPLIPVKQLIGKKENAINQISSNVKRLIFADLKSKLDFHLIDKQLLESNNLLPEKKCIDSYLAVLTQRQEKFELLKQTEQEITNIQKNITVHSSTYREELKHQNEANLNVKHRLVKTTMNNNYDKIKAKLRSIKSMRIAQQNLQEHLIAEQLAAQKDSELFLTNIQVLPISDELPIQNNDIDSAALTQSQMQNPVHEATLDKMVNMKPIMKFVQSGAERRNKFSKNNSTNIIQNTNYSVFYDYKTNRPKTSLGSRSKTQDLRLYNLGKVNELVEQHKDRIIQTKGQLSRFQNYVIQKGHNQRHKGINSTSRNDMSSEITRNLIKKIPTQSSRQTRSYSDSQEFQYKKEWDVVRINCVTYKKRSETLNQKITSQMQSNQRKFQDFHKQLIKLNQQNTFKIFLDAKKLVKLNAQNIY